MTEQEQAARTCMRYLTVMRKRDCSCYAFLFSSYCLPPANRHPSLMPPSSSQRRELRLLTVDIDDTVIRCGVRVISETIKKNHNRIKFVSLSYIDTRIKENINILKFNASNCVDLWLIWGFEFEEESISIKIRSISSVQAKKREMRSQIHIHLIFIFLFVCRAGKKLFTFIIRTKTIRCISLYSTFISR